MLTHARQPLAAALALLLSSPAWAADADTDKPAEQTAPNKLEAVVVTGDKLRRSELETTQSVGMRNRRQIEEASSLSVEDLVSRMANVGTAQGLTIRGIPLYGPGGGDGQTATITVDGVAQEGAGQSISDLSVWDAEAIEVLRGPQSTNQGRNALAGAVVLRTRNPTDEWDLRGRASVGNHSSGRIAVAGGGALVKDLAAFRLAIEQRRDAGSVHNETLGDRRWDHDDGSTFRGKLRLTPFEGDYQALITYTDALSHRGNSYVDVTLRAPSQRVSLANEPSQLDKRARSLALEQSWRWAGAEWTWLSSWAHNSFVRRADYDSTELNQGLSTSDFGDRHQSQELRANFSTTLFGQALKGVAGLFASNGRNSGDSLYLVPVSYVLGIFGQCPQPAACEARYKADFINRLDLRDQRLRNRALFSEFDYQLGRFTLTAGLRYDREEQGRAVGAVSSGSTPVADAIVKLLLDNRVVAPDGTQQLDTRYQAWLPKLALRYQIDADWQTGLAVQRGYRTGGVNYSYQRGSNAYAPEYTTNYDFSVKGQVLPGVLLAANAYRVDWRDQQVNVGANSLDVFYVNAGQSRLQGLELELRGQVQPALELFGALGLSRTKFLSFSFPSGDYTGKQFPSSPRQTASLGFSWKPGAWTVNADVVHEGGTFSDASNAPDRRNPSHTVLNSKLSYALTPKIRAFAFGQNLGNQTYTTYLNQATSSRQVALLGQGRLLGLGLEAQL